MKNAIKVASLAFFLVSLSAGELNAQYQEWWTAITYQGGLAAGFGDSLIPANFFEPHGRAQGPPHGPGGVQQGC